MSNSLEEELINFGLNSLFRSGGYGRASLARTNEKDSVLLHKDFAGKWFGLLGEDEKQSSLEYVSKHFPTIYSDGGQSWSNLIDETSSGEVDYKSIHGWYGKSLVVQAATLNPKYDWSILFNKVISENPNGTSYISHSIRIIVDCYSEYDKKGFYDYVFKNAKSHKWETRALLYQALIKSGTLTSKMARKMRSDGAAKASRCAVKSLISNKDLYPDNHSLFVQFVDTTYEEVASELARNIPESMLTYMVGSQFYHVKRVIQDRMMQIEKRKEDEERGFVAPEDEVPF